MIRTEIIKLDPMNPDNDKILRAAKTIRDGGLVIFPTETVYGIGANMLNKEALKRLYQIKQRAQGKPFSIHIGSREKAQDYAAEIPAAAYRLMEKFWPGPMALIFKAKDGSSVGLRLPDNAIALNLINSADVPVVAPSANLSGNPAAVTFQDAIKDFQGKVEIAIDAGPTKFGKESTIVDFSVQPARIIREGAVKKEDVVLELNRKAILFVCTGNSCRSVMAKFYLEKRLKDTGRNDITVFSAGVVGLEGMGATQEVIQLLRQDGIDVSGHRAEKVSPEIIKQADLILVMERVHEEEILRLAPQAKNKIFLLKEFAKISQGDLEISDPIGKPLNIYEQTFAIIKEAIERIIKII